MGDVIGEILPNAVAVAVSPIPVIAVILMLLTPGARSNGFAFLVGWVGGISLVGILVVFLLSDVVSDDSGGESTTSGVIKIVLGAFFLVLAARNWRARPRGDEEPEMPKWMSAIDQFSAPKSAGLAFFLAAINPKNLILTAAAVSTIAAAGLETGEEVAALAVFVFIASLTVAIPVLGYLLAGDRVQPTLDSTKQWLVVNNHTVMAVLLLVIGAKVIGDGIQIVA